MNDVTIVSFNGMIMKWEVAKLMAKIEDVQYATPSELRQYYYMRIC